MEMGKARTIATWHPTYAFFHNPFEWGSFRVDLDRFARLLRGQIAKPPKRLVTNPTKADLVALRREGLTLAVDIETRPCAHNRPWTGKDPTQAKLKSIGIGNIHWGISFLWSDREPGLTRELADILRHDTTVWQNGPWFDHRVLRRYGFRVEKWEDCRDARRAVSSTSRLNLAHLASLYDDCGPWKEGDEGDAKGLVFTSDLDALKRYNAQDCVETARVWAGLLNEPEWKEDRTQRLYELHKQQSVLAAEMHTNGFRVDFRERQRLSKELLRLFLERRKALLDYVGIPAFKCNANSMRSLLFKKHETKDIARFHLEDPIGPKRYTKTGLVGVDLPNLLLVVCDPLCPDILRRTVDLYWQAASAWKMRSTYVATLKVEHAIGRDKRLRPSWNSCGTDTGRWSCADPNIQNLSAADRHADIRGALPDVRRMYRADAGRVLVHFDKSQLELRVRAAVMGDTVLEADLATGDVYGANAKDWFALPADWNVKKLIKRLETPEQFTAIELEEAKRAKVARFACKTVHLASQYAAGDQKVYQICLKDDRTMKFRMVRGLHNGFKRRYEATVKFWFEEMERVMQCGYSETRILGRRRVYPRPPSINDTANYPVQGTAADIISLELVELRKRVKDIPGCRILTHEHDASTLEVPRKYQEETVKLVEEVSGKAKYHINGRDWVFPIETKCAIRWSDV